MVRIITQEEQRELLTFEEAFDAISNGNKDWGDYSDKIVNRPRNRIFNPETNVRLSVHSGSSPRQNSIGSILHPEIPESDREVQEYANKGEQACVIYDETTAELKGIILGDIQVAGFPSEGLRGCQTAMDAVVDIDRLVSDHASTLGIFGSGKQAKHHLVAIDHLRDLDHIRVYSPTKDHRLAFKEQMRKLVDANIEVVNGPEEVIHGTDIVMCATNASSPIFDGELLEKGQTVISIVGSDISLVTVGSSPHRRREIDNRTISRADIVVTRSISLAKRVEQGDLYEPVQDEIIDWNDIIEMRDIVTGDHPGRDNSEQLIVYKQNSRQGITQLALMAKVFAKAKAKKIGAEI